VSNPFLDRIAQRGTSGHGRASENRVAKALGARLQPNSGAVPGFKSDATMGNFRLEMKSTVNKCLDFDMAWLAKITKEAETKNQVPAVVFSFVTPEGEPRQKKNSEWIAMPLWKFKELMG
jgi:hypothetical protein